MSTYTENPIVVWVAVGDRKETCDFGQEHIVRYFTSKQLGPVVGTREHDNGYEKRQTDVRQDHQGRWYHQHIQIDFFNNVSWVRDDDGERFYPRPQTAGTADVARDMLGRTIRYSGGRVHVG